MINPVAIASSALASYGLNQAVTANNIANIATPGFKASTAVTQEVKGGGVHSVVRQGQDTVDISREAVNLLANRTDFTANLKVLKTENDMTKKLLNILA
jgi:flagellar basal body rod protein FlgB